MTYEPVIGLEVHVQLRTRRKMFARAPQGYGHEPNTLLDPVVLALPGTLPVLNKAAIDHMILMGLLFGCTIAKRCKWDRKNYWYPDSPKNYQISQYDQPLCTGGAVEIELPGPNRATMGEHLDIPLTRIHLEEDPGKLTHFGNYSLIDDNRTGTPLAEIVTEPALRTADEAVAFLKAVRLSLIAAGIADCDMEKGQMRCDANVSLRPKGSSILNTRTEMKNLNSFSAVKAAILSEIQRQESLYTSGRAAEIIQETRRWDADRRCTFSLRGKEEAMDYRYFPDPDLMPVEVDESWKETLRQRLPERPYERQRRYLQSFGLPCSTASVLINDPVACHLFEETTALGARPRDAANLIVNDLSRLRASNDPQDQLEAPPDHGDAADSPVARGDGDTSPDPATPDGFGAITAPLLAELLQLIENNTISRQIAQDILPELFQNGISPSVIVQNKGLAQNNDDAELEKFCAEAIAADPAAVSKFRSGNEKAINAFKGPVMKATKGKAAPQAVDRILRRLLAQ